MKQYLKLFTRYYLLALFWGLFMSAVIGLCTFGVSYVIQQDISQAINDVITSVIITAIIAVVGGGFVGVFFTFLELD